VRLKLDENLGQIAADLLRQAGHDISTVPEQGLYGATDTEIIQTCRGDRRCLVTLDLDFGNPLIFNPSDYNGIAVLRLPARTTPRDSTDALRTLIGGLDKESIEQRLWVIQRGRIRVYQPEETEKA